jgi:hypothetical protein
MLAAAGVCERVLSALAWSCTVFTHAIQLPGQIRKVPQRRTFLRIKERIQGLRKQNKNERKSRFVLILSNFIYIFIYFILFPLGGAVIIDTSSFFRIIR